MCDCPAVKIVFRVKRPIVFHNGGMDDRRGVYSCKTPLYGYSMTSKHSGAMLLGTQYLLPFNAWLFHDGEKATADNTLLVLL